MYSIRYVRGHVQVYDRNGMFLFSADNEREAREELDGYEDEIIHTVKNALAEQQGVSDVKITFDLSDS